MVNHPEMQDKVYKEINQVLGERQISSLKDRLHLPYTEVRNVTIFMYLFNRVSLRPKNTSFLCIKDLSFPASFFVAFAKNTMNFPNLKGKFYQMCFSIML